jgi:hypothetical protein
MDQLSHAPVCKAVFVSGGALWQTLDKDGTQRLILMVVDCGISIQKVLPATEIIHGCALKCEVVSRGVRLSVVVPNWEPQAKPDGPQGFKNQEKSRAQTGRPAE